jgi:hypothetical protein
MVGFEHRYILDFCSICSSQNGLVVELKGPTTGVNILCVDGGGSRGIIPLKVLSSLQAMIGPDLPIQNFFDLKFGTSAGTLSHPKASFTYDGRWSHCAWALSMGYRYVHRKISVAYQEAFQPGSSLEADSDS